MTDFATTQASQGAAASGIRTAGVSAAEADRENWIISNRGPGTYDEEGRLAWKKGGLSMVLIPPAVAAAQEPGTKVTWLAAADGEGDVARQDDGKLWTQGPAAPRQKHPVELRFLELSPRELQMYYGVIANTALWLGLHGSEHHLSRNEILEAWPVYEAVNRRFADFVALRASPGATVQVHDFQLALAGQMLQEMRPDLRIVGYWHIPMDSEKTVMRSFRETPLHRPCTEALYRAMGAIPMAFQRTEWAALFHGGYRRLIGHRPPAETSIMPVFVDRKYLECEARMRQVDEAIKQIDREMQDANRGEPFSGKVIGFVGRGDPKNGIPRLIDAWEKVLADDSIEDKPALVLNSGPTRPGVKAFDDHWELIERRVAEVRVAHPNAILLMRGETRADAVAIFRRADVAVIPSLAGGRDIVGQEAVAFKTHGDRPGVVVTSAGAGTSDTLFRIPRALRDGIANVPRSVAPGDWLPGALLVSNVGPRANHGHAVRAFAGAIKAALVMSPREVAQRQSNMRLGLEVENPEKWFGFLNGQARTATEVADDLAARQGRVTERPFARYDLFAEILEAQRRVDGTFPSPADGNTSARGGADDGGLGLGIA